MKNLPLLLTVKSLSETHLRLGTNSSMSCGIMYLWVHWLLVLKIPILALGVFQEISTIKKKSKLLSMRQKDLSGLALLSIYIHSTSFPSHLSSVSWTCHAFNTYYSLCMYFSLCTNIPLHFLMGKFL